jgi:hypothetical protein
MKSNAMWNLNEWGQDMEEYVSIPETGVIVHG